LRMYHHSFHQERERSYFYNQNLETKLRNKQNQKWKMNKILYIELDLLNFYQKIKRFMWKYCQILLFWR
jgi:hypothetical protein